MNESHPINEIETMTIRLEQPEDYREVENLTRNAFWNIYRPGCTEHYVPNQYRHNPDFIPELDFVMEEDPLWRAWRYPWADPYSPFQYPT